MQELRIASSPIISSILENTEIATCSFQIARSIESDPVKLKALQNKISANEEFMGVLREILENHKRG